MRAYVLRRLLQSLLVLFLFSVALRALLDAMPGDPTVMAMFNRPNIKPEDIERIERIYGLKDPFAVKYSKWMYQVFVNGEMGVSRTEGGRPVSELIREYTWNSLKLMSGAFLLSLLVAIPLGIFAAVRQYSAVDYVTGFFSFMGISVPSFWLGIMAIYFFCVYLGWFPPGGMAPIGKTDVSLYDRLHYLALPTAVLSVQTIAVWIRHMRASMLEVVHEDYVRTARAKGVSEVGVIGKHALRNALIPIVTLLALSIPDLFSGALITETIFSWPGMGRLLYRSVINKDHMVAMIAFLILAALTLLCNLLADLLYAVVDPRIRLN